MIGRLLQSNGAFEQTAASYRRTSGATSTDLSRPVSLPTRLKIVYAQEMKIVYPARHHTCRSQIFEHDGPLRSILIGSQSRFVSSSARIWTYTFEGLLLGTTQFLWLQSGSKSCRRRVCHWRHCHCGYAGPSSPSTIFTHFSGDDGSVKYHCCVRGLLLCTTLAVVHDFLHGPYLLLRFKTLISCLCFGHYLRVASSHDKHSIHGSVHIPLLPHHIHVILRGISSAVRYAVVLVAHFFNL
ncbi:hypothetical protein CPB85DRAFT_103270 [Mucidula mucida]|nr:hypothetical protein CPB85DRAFT_103270 [Mucidula mucida]